MTVRAVVVGNPASGRSRAALLERVGTAAVPGAEVRVVLPESRDVFAEAIRGEVADVVVVAAGDGTFSDVVNALFDRLDELVFAIVPMGTGNDLVRSLGLPLDPLDAARAVAGGCLRSIDLWRARGRITERLFVNACTGGLPAHASAELTPALKRLSGPVAFWVAGAKVAPRLPRSTVTVNGRAVTDCVSVGVGNGRSCAGGLEVWPQARLDDGLLECVVLPASGYAPAVRLAAKVKTTQHEEIGDVVSFRSDEIVITSDPDIEFSVDGELIGLTTPARFERAGSIRMIVSRSPPST